MFRAVGIRDVDKDVLIDVLNSNEGAMEILGWERRRRWTEAEKLEIVAAVGVNGETLSRVARRYDVSRGEGKRHCDPDRRRPRPA